MKKLVNINISGGILAFAVIAAVAFLMVVSRPSASARTPHSLLGSTPNEIAAYAIEYAQGQREVIKGAPTALLSRSVTRGQITALGLGCLGGFAAIEEPPLNLVILKGDFVFSTSASQRYSLNSKYLAYVFDAWSGEHVYRLASIDGSHFRLALNDPSLPVAKAALPASCPTQIPASMKKLHYGEIAPPIAGNPTTVVTVDPTVTLVPAVPVPVPSTDVP
ncbi:MAG TPA: hypothetical protein VF952_20065 [Chloroflexia bacterium]|jgi:hypothetical protein